MFLTESALRRTCHFLHGRWIGLERRAVRRDRHHSLQSRRPQPPRQQQHQRLRKRFRLLFGCLRGLQERRDDAKREVQPEGHTRRRRMREADPDEVDGLLPEAHQQDQKVSARSSTADDASSNPPHSYDTNIRVTGNRLLFPLFPFTINTFTRLLKPEGRK